MGSKDNILNGVSWVDTYRMFCVLLHLDGYRLRYHAVNDRLHRYEDVAMKRYEYTLSMIDEKYMEIIG